jgi:hypothetical protein
VCVEKIVLREQEEPFHSSSPFFSFRSYVKLIRKISRISGYHVPVRYIDTRMITAQNKRYTAAKAI